MVVFHAIWDLVGDDWNMAGLFSHMLGIIEAAWQDLLGTATSSDDINHNQVVVSILSN